MMQKNLGRSAKKILLLTGLSLCSFLVLAMGQHMGEALGLGKIASSSVLPPRPLQDLPQKLEVASLDRVALLTQPTPQSKALSRLSSASTQSKPQSPSSQIQPQAVQQNTLAINSGTADSVQQPIAQDIAAIELAAVSNEWSGASFPVEDFQEYTSAFGYRSSPDGGYTQEFHYGLDMAAPEGSYVRNWWPGKVVEVTDNTNCGTSVVIESGPWTHIYCHMQGHVEQTANGLVMIDREGGVQMGKGQDVPAGARIGRVGMTGRTTGPHLHWGLKYDSNWVDPALVLLAMYSNQQASIPGDRPSQ